MKYFLLYSCIDDGEIWGRVVPAPHPPIETDTPVTIEGTLYYVVGNHITLNIDLQEYTTVVRIKYVM